MKNREKWKKERGAEWECFLEGKRTLASKGRLGIYSCGSSGPHSQILVGSVFCFLKCPRSFWLRLVIKVVVTLILIIHPPTKITKLQYSRWATAILVFMTKKRCTRCLVEWVIHRFRGDFVMCLYLLTLSTDIFGKQDKICGWDKILRIWQCVEKTKKQYALINICLEFLI